MGSVRLYVVALLLLASSCCLWQPALGRPGSPQLLLHRLKRSRNGHYCGSELTTMLEIVCSFISHSSGKRSDNGGPHGSTGNMHDYNGDQLANELGGPVRSLGYPSYSSRRRLVEEVDPLQDGGRRRQSRSTHPGGPDHVRVKRQGIVDECCFNACSIQVLETYCDL